MNSQPSRLGFFVSYNEKLSGKFQDAVNVCDAHDYIVWLGKTGVNKQRFQFPTTILIKISGENRYYLGELIEVKRAQEIDRNALLAEASYRPRKWQQMDKSEYADFKSVLYIAGLRQVHRPAGIAADMAPQRPRYMPEVILRS